MADLMQQRTPEVWVQVQREGIDEAAALAFLRTAEAGGIAVFVGTTRRWTERQETARLEYEGYVPMAVRELQRLVEEACRRWPARRVCVLHRLGLVPLGEASVLVGVATPHRAEAFEACRFLIDALKQQVPIWKREVYVDGTTAWVEGSAPPGVKE